MAVAAAEQVKNWPPLIEGELIYAVPEMGLEDRARAQAAQLIRNTLANHAPVAEVELIENRITSLSEAIHLAANGDEEARKFVAINARTDMLERGIKVGHVMNPVPLAIAPNGKIIQYGQTGEMIQANSLRFASSHPVMRARTEAETRNAYRTEHLYEQGWFEDYSLVVFSLAEDLPEAGFFNETMSAAIQVTAKTDEGLAIETAFVAGISEPGKQRHDMDTIVEIGRQLGVDFSGKSRAGILDTPVLVHNSLMPNGAIDVVEKLWDKAAGGTFFGENKPAQDYLDYRAECSEREAMWEPKAGLVAQELIERSAAIREPLDAVKLLNKISGKHLVEQAVFDASIDPRVFVDETAIRSVIAARQAIEAGHYEQAFSHMDTAKRTEQSSSCPTGMQNGSTSGEDNKDSASIDRECTFVSKECPVCGKKNVLTTVTKTHIKGSCKCVVGRAGASV